MAKVYLSVFPEAKAAEVLKGVTSNAPLIKHELSQITKHQFRRMPELFFYIDDSLQYSRMNNHSKKKKTPLRTELALQEKNDIGIRSIVMREELQQLIERFVGKEPFSSQTAL